MNWVYNVHDLIDKKIVTKKELYNDELPKIVNVPFTKTGDENVYNLNINHNRIGFNLYSAIYIILDIYDNNRKIDSYYILKDIYNAFEDKNIIVQMLKTYGFIKG